MNTLKSNLRTHGTATDSRSFKYTRNVFVKASVQNCWRSWQTRKRNHAQFRCNQ